MILPIVIGSVQEWKSGAQWSQVEHRALRCKTLANLRQDFAHRKREIGCIQTLPLSKQETVVNHYSTGFPFTFNKISRKVFKKGIPFFFW